MYTKCTLFFHRSTIFLTNIGKIVYPSYEIFRQTVIFQDRDDVISYDLANQDLCRMDCAIEHKKFGEAITIYYKAHQQFEEILKKISSGDPRLIYVSFNEILQFIYKCINFFKLLIIMKKKTNEINI